MVLILVILPALVIIALAVILGHQRKDRLLREYVLLARQDLPAEGTGDHLRPLREYILTGSLRKGVFAAVMGLALLVVPSLAAPWIDHYLGIGSTSSLLGRPADFSGSAGFFYLCGLLVLAYGISNLVVWFVVDRPRLRDGAGERKARDR